MDYKYPIRILYVNGGILDMGGISVYMMNYYRNFDKDILKIDFLVQGNGKNKYIEEIESYGGKVYQIPNKSTDVIGNLRGMYKIIKQGKYDIVHSHADAGNGVVLKIAKMVGVPIRISHSHSTNYYTKSSLKRYINSFQKRMILKAATHLWGCSNDACEWLYSSKAKYTVINNAIDVQKYRFSEKKRNDVRKDLDLDANCLAVCQVGHFNDIKNQEYSIKVIQYIKDNYPKQKIRMFFIGDGENRKKIENLVENDSCFIFMGIRLDVNDIMQGMDVLLLPSFFEGFPVTLVEAQASGVFSIASNKVTKDVCLCDDLVRFLPIDDASLRKWADICLNYPKMKRTEAERFIIEKGFSICESAISVQNEYLNLTRGLQQ